MGVWDTVDAVGLPIAAPAFVNHVIYSFKFPDRILNSSVAHACHALALDEERESFAPVLWDETKTPDPARIEQVWFAGVHSNVGGGYPRQGMSLVPLDWIMTKAEAAPHHLCFVPAEREMYRFHADVDDKMYDSRAGVGVFYRWLPRNVRRLCVESGVTPKVHGSVFERIARNTEGYAPGSIPSDPEVISMSQPPAVTNAIRTLVRTQHGSPEPLVERASGLQRVGRFSYWLFVYGILVTLFFVLRAFVRQAMQGADTWPGVAGNLAGGVLSSRWITLALQTLWNRWWLLTWLAITLPLALAVDAQLDSRYSQFWHAGNMRLNLRKALGLG
jgi:hypothetical protein